MLLASFHHGSPRSPQQRWRWRWRSLSALFSPSALRGTPPCSQEEEEEEEEAAAADEEEQAQGREERDVLLHREQSRFGTQDSDDGAAAATASTPRSNLDLSYYASLLKSASSPESTRNGRSAHHGIVHIGLDQDPFVGSHVVLMYGSCGALDDALRAFEGLLGSARSTVFSWNFMVRALARHGESDKVLFLVGLMQQQGVAPTKVTFVSVFDACSFQPTAEIGRRLHATVIGSSFEADAIVATALTNMYGKFGMIEIAMHCFDLMRDHDVVAWTALISAFQRCGDAVGAGHSFNRMMQEASIPNEVSFINLCEACEGRASLRLGKQVHVRIIMCSIRGRGLQGNLAVENALVNMYGKCGCVSSAKLVFERMEESNLVTWTSVVSACSQNGHGKEAIQHFVHSQQRGVLPDRILLSIALSAFGNPCFISLCKQMHATIVLTKQPMVDVFLGTILINTYWKCKDVNGAKLVFHGIMEKNIFAWNAMVSAYSQNGCHRDAFYVFGQMHEEAMLPNDVTFVSIFNACAKDPSGTALKRGSNAHASCVVVQPETDVQNALIDMYGKHNRIHTATSIFNDMSKRDSVTWNAIIAAHTLHGQGREALAYFDQMWQAGIQPDGATFVSILSTCMDEASLAEGQKIHFVVQESGHECDVMVATAIVSMYGRCKSIHDAEAAFGRMNARSEVSWNAMIAVYAHFERFEDVLDLFDQMQHDGVLPDHVTLVTVLSVCIHKFAISEGTKLHAYIIETDCHADVVLNTMLLNMYGKLGSLYDAQRTFERMQDRNTVSWNTMMAVYTQHGSAMRAFTTFNQMQAEGITANKVTYINVLGACSHSGLQQEAHWYFKVMMEIHSSSLAVDHYICFIDLLARSGRLREAELVISNMPVQPSAVSFMALLGACRYKDDIQQAEEASKYVSELEPDHYGSHLVLSSMYSSLGRAASIINEFPLQDCSLLGGGTYIL